MLLASNVIEILETLERSELAKGMDESDKARYLVPLALELANGSEEEPETDQVSSEETQLLLTGT